MALAGHAPCPARASAARAPAAQLDARASAATAAQALACVSLPPKPPPMRRHCTIDLVPRHVEHVRDDLLRLATGAASTTATNRLAVLVARRQRRLRLEVEVLLPADGELAAAGGAALAASARAGSPRAHALGLGVEALLRRCASLDRQDRRQRLVLDAAPAAAPARACSSVSASTQATAWPWKQTSLGEQRLVVARRPDVVLAGDVVRGEHAEHARAAPAPPRRRCATMRACACGAAPARRGASARRSRGQIVDVLARRR